MLKKIALILLAIGGLTDARRGVWLPLPIPIPQPAAGAGAAATTSAADTTSPGTTTMAGPTTPPPCSMGCITATDCMPDAATGTCPAPMAAPCKMTAATVCSPTTVMDVCACLVMAG